MSPVCGFTRGGGGWLLLAALIVLSNGTPSAKAQAKPDAEQGVPPPRIFSSFTSRY